MNGGSGLIRIPGPAPDPDPQEPPRARPEPHPRGGGDPRRPDRGPLLRRRPRPGHRAGDLRDEEHGAVHRSRGFGDVHRLRRRVRRVGRPERYGARPGHPVGRLADRAARSRRRERACRRGHRGLHQHRRGHAPVRRPGRRRGLPLQPVRGAGLAPGVRRLRAARPQGHVRLHGHGARPTGRSGPSPPRRAEPGRRPRRDLARDVDLRADPGPLLLRHRHRVRALRRRHRHRPEPSGSRRAAACMRVARSSSTSTPTTSST